MAAATARQLFGGHVALLLLATRPSSTASWLTNSCCLKSCKCCLSCCSLSPCIVVRRRAGSQSEAAVEGLQVRFRRPQARGQAQRLRIRRQHGRLQAEPPAGPRPGCAAHQALNNSISIRNEHDFWSDTKTEVLAWTTSCRAALRAVAGVRFTLCLNLTC